MEDTGPHADAIRSMDREFENQDATAPPGTLNPSDTPTKNRSLSDSHPVLDPSPKFREPPTKARDDNVLIATPSRHSRRAALSLQMPPRDVSNLFSGIGKATFSPQSEGREAFISPTTVLPRHSRGLDISRACTNLHHSTSIDQATPDSSPTVAHKSLSSRRTSNVSMLIDSPRQNSMSSWPGLSNEKVLFPRNLASGTALSSDASSSSEDDNDTYMRGADAEDAILMTPQLRKNSTTGVFTPYGSRGTASNNWTASHSPMARGLPHFQRYSMERQSSLRESDASSSGPPSARSDHLPRDAIGSTRESIDSEMSISTPASRRESMTIGTDGLHISNLSDQYDSPETNPQGNRSNVTRRPVTRRSNLLPKTKGFARIRAQLQEETTPVDCETRREAEVVRQVRIKDVGQNVNHSIGSSPDLTPTVIPNVQSEEGFESSDTDGIPSIAANNTSNGSIETSRASDERRRSNKGVWPQLYNNRMQTPPPPLFHRNRSYSNRSEGDSSHVSTPPSTNFSATSGLFLGNNTNGSILENITETPLEISLDSNPSNSITSHMPSQAEITRKVNNKRRRDDDLDINSFKRRAVSPGMSVHSSPVLGQSPVSSSGGWWGTAPGSQLQKNNRENSGSSIGDDQARSNGTTNANSINVPTSATSTPTLGPKRVGLQGMSDTSDGLMKMVIE